MLTQKFLSARAVRDSKGRFTGRYAYSLSLPIPYWFDRGWAAVAAVWLLDGAALVALLASEGGLS